MQQRTDLRRSVFCASRGVVMPWWLLPSPSPSFHPIFCIILWANVPPPWGAASAAPALPNLHRPELFSRLICSFRHCLRLQTPS